MTVMLKAVPELAAPELPGGEDSGAALLARLEAACDSLGLEEGLRAMLRQPERELTVSLPVIRDSGGVAVYTGYRVQHSSARGPCAGGVCFRPELTLVEARRLALLMTLRCAVVNLPLGGAYGGVAVDPALLSKAELQRLTRRYATAILPLLGSKKDIPAPDATTPQETAVWLADTFSTLQGSLALEVATGKPLGLGGCQGRPEAPGRAVALAAVEMLKRQGRPPEKMRLVIQGLDSTGWHAAVTLAGEYGCRIVAVGDASAGLYNPRGINLATLRAQLDGSPGGLLSGFYPNGLGERLTSAALLALDADVLVLAGPPNQLNAANAGRVRAGLIVEGADDSTTLEAEAMLRQRGITIVPDILAAAGEVICAYLEWVQGQQEYFWELAEVRRQLQRLMSAAFTQVWDLAQARQLDLRSAAYRLAVQQLAETIVQRGVFP